MKFHCNTELSSKKSPKTKKKTKRLKSPCQCSWRSPITPQSRGSGAQRDWEPTGSSGVSSLGQKCACGRYSWHQDSWLLGTKYS